MLAGDVRRHADHLNGFTLFERRDDLRGPACRLERETDFVFQIVIPTQGLSSGPASTIASLWMRSSQTGSFRDRFMALAPERGARRCVRYRAGERSLTY